VESLIDEAIIHISQIIAALLLISLAISINMNAIHSYDLHTNVFINYISGFISKCSMIKILFVRPTRISSSYSNATVIDISVYKDIQGTVGVRI